MKYQTVVAAVICVALATATQANDSAAKVSAGGIVLEKTDSVRMNSEELYVSKELVKVNYVYENITNTALELTVTFPLPKINAEDVFESYPDHYDKTKFIDFATKLNGVPVKPKEIVVISSNDGRNVTDFFRTRSLPLAPFDEFWSFDFDNNFDSIKMVAVADDLRAAGLLIKDKGGYERRAWSTQIYYVWQHTFEPNQPVTVEHQYAPITGGQFFTGDVEYDGWSFKNYFQKEYCASENEWKALEKIAAKYETPLISEVGYILQTGNNWAGPIGEFNMIIDKSDARNIITLCWDGELTKIAPTQFQFKATNYIPQQNIVMAITQGFRE